MARWLTGHPEPTLAGSEQLDAIERAAVALAVLQAQGRLPVDRRDAAGATARQALDRLLAAGLRRQLGQRLTSTAPPPGVAVVWRPEPGPLDIYRALIEGGLPPPARLNVCADCALVFESGKRRAKKCPRCHASPRPESEYAAHRSTYPVDRLDAASERVGWQLRTYTVCEVCGRPFYAKRAHARRCSARCRQRLSRARRS
ncbi:MAG: hypothetical protein ACJ766_09455 [Thermoleophilaceae bacterium]